MNSLQERFITSNIEDTFLNNDDFTDIGNRDYTSAGGGGYRGRGFYRGHLPYQYQRPIVIIQPARGSQEFEDPLIEGLTSLLPLAYLVPLTLLATARLASPSSTLGRRRRRETGQAEVPLAAVLMSHCAERLSCVSSDLTTPLNTMERNLATRLAGILLNHKDVPPERRQRIERAGLWAGLYPGHCSAFNCRLT